MSEYEFETTEFGVRGVLPDGEVMEFATEEDYHEAYVDQENQIYDEMCETFHYDEPVDYPEHEWLLA